MEAEKESKHRLKLFKLFFSGKHSNNKLKLFDSNNPGKHARSEMVVYNPVYAKISSCLGSIAIMTSFLALATLGKYKGTLASSDTARVAKYVLELTDSGTEITEFIPNTTQNIEFEIKNFEGELGNITKQNEANLNYKIVADLPTTWNLPIECTLYRVYGEGNEEEITFVNGQSQAISVEDSTAVHKYRLEIVWQAGYDEIDYQNLTDNMKIWIESEQVD